MIISHEHKFIFIKTKKTAGTSLEIALSRYCGSRDIISPLSPEEEKYRRQKGYRGKQNYFIMPWRYNAADMYMVIKKKKNMSFTPHFSMSKIIRIKPELRVNEYFKFCFERNPFDKLISYYFWRMKRGITQTLDEFLQSGQADKVSSFEQYTIDSIPVVDKIYKFEEMDSALVDISRNLGFAEELKLPEKKFKGEFRKNSQKYKSLLSAKNARLISVMFAREIALMGYQY